MRNASYVFYVIENVFDLKNAFVGVSHLRRVTSSLTWNWEPAEICRHRPQPISVRLSTTSPPRHTTPSVMTLLMQLIMIMMMMTTLMTWTDAGQTAVPVSASVSAVMTTRSRCLIYLSLFTFLSVSVASGFLQWFGFSHAVPLNPNN